MTDISKLHPKKILVCQLRQIGDVLLATPAIELLKERFPDAQLHVLTEKKCIPVLINNPHVDHIWPIDKKALRNPLKALLYYFKVGRAGYDLIVDFQQLPRCKWVVGFSDAPVKLTFEPPWYNRFLYTHWAEQLQGYAGKAKASILGPLGIKWNFQRPRIWLTEEERAGARRFLLEHHLEGKPYITVDPSHRRETRRWPARHFAGLLRMLHEKHPDLMAVILYGPGERDLAEKVAGMTGDMAVVPRNMLGLREMAAVLENAVMHLGNCSSPRHFAVAVDTPSFVIHGATGFGWRFPSDKHVSVAKNIACKHCNENTCRFGTLECLEDYPPEDVFAEALALLEKSLAGTI